MPLPVLQVELEPNTADLGATAANLRAKPSKTLKEQQKKKGSFFFYVLADFGQQRSRLVIIRFVLPIRR